MSCHLSHSVPSLSHHNISNPLPPLSSNFHSFPMCGLAWMGVNAIWMHCLHFSFSPDRHRVFFFSSCRTLTELLKQPGEAGAMDGTGVHHPIGTNGISARALRSNNGQSSLQYCMSVLYELNWWEQTEVLQFWHKSGDQTEASRSN